MPRQTEHSEHPDTLPTPELNPLLNPVLGQNMGRWAEVYFTSPPEKREQAVLELVRELEAEGSSSGDNLAAAPSWRPEPSRNPVLAADASVPQKPTLVPCSNCGREMPSTQKYCGMCGAHLSETVTAESQGENIPVEERQKEMSQYSSSQLESSGPEYVSEPEVYEPRSTSNPLSLFQTGGDAHYRDDSNDEIFSYAPPSRPYRVYVGIALALIIFTLAYMAWRSAQATSQSSHVAPQAPPAIATQPPAQVPQATPQQEVPERSASAEERPAPPSASAAHSAAPEASAKSIDVKRGRQQASNKPAPPPAAPVPERQAQEEAAAGNGAEELAVAQRYLYGTNGERQNRAEAAKWLWKALAKHNANATLLLADLYLKGDGVTKNCDQARVLLDSGARAGMKEAGERLRHLQAFGCE